MSASSSSSTDTSPAGAFAAGHAIADFRVERVLRADGAAIFCVATQAGLERRVALTLYAPDPALAVRFRAIGAIEHPHVASLYAAGEEPNRCFFTATQLTDGPTLARLAEDHWLAPQRAAALCDQVQAALQAAHAAGVAHGAVSPANVLVGRDGQVLLTGFARTEPPGGADADLAALQQMRYEVVAASGTRSSRRLVPAGLAALLAFLIAAAVVTRTSSDGPGPAAGSVPRPATGIVPLGSALTAARTRTLDCEGHVPSGSSLGCTLMQTHLPGRRLVVPEDGAIRGWVVGATRGTVALKVIRRHTEGFVVVGRSQPQQVSGAIRALPADLAVRRGDRLGVELAPGTGIGVATGPAGTATVHFAGNLGGTPRRPTRSPADRAPRELLMRVDFLPGATPKRPRVLTSSAAARAPAGRILEQSDIHVGDAVRTVAVVATSRGLALDLLAGSRRLSRVTIPDLDPRGRLFALDVFSGPDPTVTWRNPDGRLIEHHYTVGRDALAARD